MRLLSRVIIGFIICVFIVQDAVHAQSAIDDQEDNSPNLLDRIDLSEVEAYWQDMRHDYQDYLPEIDRLTVKDLVTNNQSLSIKEVLRTFLNIIGYEVIANGRLLGQLIVLTIISALLRNIQSAFQTETVNSIASFVLMLVLTTLAIQSFTAISELVIQTIGQMHSFIIALLPLQLSLLASVGGIVSVAFFHPIIISFLHITVFLTEKVILSLIFFSLILHLVSSMNKAFQLTKLADLLRQVGLGLLTVCLTVFLTVLSAQGAVTAIQDGLAIKTTKFVSNNFIPVVGRMFSDATDTIFAATHVLKNGIGIFGLVTLLLMISWPIIKVGIVGLAYKLAAAILQPIGESQLVKCLTIISKHIFYLLACLFVVSFMFMMTIVILLVASNITLMIR
ncbi:stage III sporulation protein AE [Amphibacillus sediminis]|uniref:stage III sporulation protein AE n=1 Tax=Amphibacillus sediminis TaxID=360185 RepID=UPI000834CEBE|nr:stage III sporulation protein AE [Amphibacillus sediminis]